MSAPAAVVELVERFLRNEREYRADSYKEAQTRDDFINPFFKALGWDVSNEIGKHEVERDVLLEPTVSVEGKPKRPDYSFRAYGIRQFLVEAKRPSVRIAIDQSAAFQLRRYAWSAQLPISILTNFAECAVYDCRMKPTKDDLATTGRRLYLNCTEYIDRWDELESLFTPVAISNGKLASFVGAFKEARGSLTVDEAFLTEIESWREMLAQDIAQRNRRQSMRDLNYCVQMVVDRIIFLRICEDRGIERYGRLQELCSSSQVYADFCDLFRLADDRYNSGLFHFRKEPHRETPDDLTLSLAIGNEPLVKIIQHLYYPDSPYEFSALPADILGHVYEQFLGKVIHLDMQHRAVIEEKPEVRKAGGIYYTPSYIVEYIVQATVGRYLEGRQYKQVQQLSILDPACGSGSFLIGAYQYILNWYLHQYIMDGPQKHRKEVRQRANNEWCLTTAERKRILLTHIYGVDIDAQAVEVTKLSLLLKVLEGESEDSLQPQLLYERALPDLSNNIKCGNSLISPAFYNVHPLWSFDEETRLQVNVFDWSGEFHSVLARGGFDIVIGNPPYFNVDDTWGRHDPRLVALKAQYPAIYNDKTDVLFYFLGKALQISNGRVAFIISRAFLEAHKADKLRAYLLQSAAVRQIIDFQNYYVFSGVGITTAIIVLESHGVPDSVEVYRLCADRITPNTFDQELANPATFEHVAVPQSGLSAEPWQFVSEPVAKLNAKVDGQGQPLGQVLAISQGMQTGRNTKSASVPGVS